MNLIVAILLIQPGILESVLICDSCVASENLDIYLMHGLSFQWNSTTVEYGLMGSRLKS